MRDDVDDTRTGRRLLLALMLRPPVLHLIHHRLHAATGARHSLISASARWLQRCNYSVYDCRRINARVDPLTVAVPACSVPGSKLSETIVTTCRRCNVPRDWRHPTQVGLDVSSVNLQLISLSNMRSRPLAN